ncbi:hypothetical protein ABE10_31610 [Bacillus toyonensis]|nr:hypothetical protein [Bacillus toyonensis]
MQATTQREASAYTDVIVVHPHPASRDSRQTGTYEVNLFRDGAETSGVVFTVHAPAANGSLDLRAAIDQAVAAFRCRLDGNLTSIRGLYYRAPVRPLS